ncbi:MAG: DUF2092 domain-containing protein, partial [Vicinamibacteria bacterium]
MKAIMVWFFALLFAGVAFIQEAPPPPVEPELPPGARLIDPRADELVKQMSELLASTRSFALEAEEIYDEVPAHLPRTQMTNLRHVALRRPDRMVGDASGDAINRSFWYDGKTLSVLDKEQNTHATIPVPDTIDGALDAIFERTGMVIPLADFVYEDVYARLMESVQRGVYLGIHHVGDVACHHLSFEQATIDWQLWIDAGEKPLPRKLVIAYKTEDEVPQYAVTMSKWNLNADVSDELFVFEPPEGAERIEFPTAQEPSMEEPSARAQREAEPSRGASS